MQIVVVDDSITRLKQFTANLRGHIVRTPLDLDMVEIQSGAVTNTLRCGETLIDGGCDVLYLDHGFCEINNFYGAQQGNGMDLLRGIIKGVLRCPKRAIIIHSANVASAEQMVSEAQVLDISVLRLWAPWTIPGCQLNSAIKE